MFLIKKLPINRALLIVQPYKDKANLFKESEELLVVYFAFPSAHSSFLQKIKLRQEKKPKMWEMQPQDPWSGVQLLLSSQEKAINFYLKLNIVR